MTEAEGSRLLCRRRLRRRRREGEQVVAPAEAQGVVEVVEEECLSHLGTMMMTKTMMIPVMTMQIVLMETSDGPGPHIGRNQMHT